MQHTTSRRAPFVALVVAALVAALAVVAAPAASAAPAAQSRGWVRVAHLSPDTKAVDVRLAALGGGEVLYTLERVGYGAVSDYMAVPAGTYVVSMVPTGAAASSPPVISGSVTVAEDAPVTVAAYGRNSDLRTAVFSDDLTQPDRGSARIRVVQASVRAGSVDVATTTGLQVAEGARTGTATGYATVPAGPWTLDVSGDGSGSATVELGSGTVNTLLVLDDAAGGQTLKAVLDASGAGTTPAQGTGIDTGAGWGATQAPASGGTSAALVVGVLALAFTGAGAALSRRARPAAAGRRRAVR